MENNNIPNIPKDLKEITPEWISQILNVSIDLKTWKCPSNVSDGTGFLSLMARIEFESENPFKKHNYVVKLIPPVESSLEGARDIMLNDKFDKIEIEAYKSLLPMLLKENPALEQNLCKVVYAEVQEENLSVGQTYSSVIILEDLKTASFSLVGYGDLIDKKYFYQGLDFIANFHVASHSLEKKLKKPISEVFPWTKNWYSPELYDAHVPTNTMPGLYRFIVNGFPHLFKLLGDKTELAHLTPTFRKIESNIRPIMQNLFRAAQEFPVIIHGDLWPHNYLIHESLPMKVIDWQLTGYTDPIIEVAFFIVLSSNIEDLNLKSVEARCKYYYELYEKLCKDRGMVPTRNWVDFQNFFMTFGLAYAMLMVMSGAECFPSIKNGIEKNIKTYQLFDELKVPEFMLSLVA